MHPQKLLCCSYMYLFVILTSKTVDRRIRMSNQIILMTFECDHTSQYFLCDIIISALITVTYAMKMILMVRCHVNFNTVISVCRHNPLLSFAKYNIRYSPRKSSTNELIIPWTKWLPFRTGEFQMHFNGRNVWYIHSNFNKVCLWWPNWQYVNIGLDDGSAPNRRQAII